MVIRRKLINKKVKALRTFAFLFLIVTSSIIYLIYNDLNSLEDRVKHEENSLKKQEWIYIKGVITETQKRSSLQSEDISDEIRNDILKEYKTGESLQYDIENLSKDTPLLSIINTRIQNRYINIENGNNEPLVATRDIILADSLYSPKKRSLLPWTEAPDYYANSKLSKLAIDSLLNQKEEEVLFWEYRENPDKSHELIKEMNMDEMERIFLKEGLNGLKTYEVLSVSYLDKDKDIFNQPDFNNLGQPVPNNKLIVIQGFNVYDAIVTNHKEFSTYYADKFHEVKSSIESEMKYKKFALVMIVFLNLSCFISLVTIHNHVIEINRLQRAERGAE